ncbi:hypothetical protein GBA63_10425 [Rubrobacter tropicus]|uniref:Uncharacterized protein n=1 Tax=Rubrobacter tropicus TaxID=2653851 RepID=A0A6G8Q9B7_9ACTN|nr:hypothetical protein [Rubrobacter tropicus]QIN83018.1 hypothetical protein GBA63_10425 [Rubrobacter tropicus]
MLVTGDAAGTLATRTAGLIRFHATLEWDEAPAGPGSCLPAPEPFFKHDLEEVLDPAGTLLRITGTILAPTDRGLGAGLERVMRSVSNAATLSGAVLEMRSFKERRPRPAPPGPLQALALDLWRAGFSVRFSPCWTPAPSNVLALGVHGDEEALLGFLRESALWEPS